MGRRRGFTMVEVMFGLLVSGLLLGILFRIFLATSHQGYRLDARFEAERSAADACEVLTRALGQLVTLPLERDEEGAVVPRAGDHARPVWIAEDGRALAFYVPGEADAEGLLADPFSLSLVPAPLPGTFHLGRRRGSLADAEEAAVFGGADAPDAPGGMRLYRGILLRSLRARVVGAEPAAGETPGGEALELVVVGVDRLGEEERALSVLVPLGFAGQRRATPAVSVAEYRPSGPLEPPQGVSNPRPEEAAAAARLEQLAEAFEGGQLGAEELVAQAREALEPIAGTIPTGGILSSGAEVPGLPGGAEVLTPAGLLPVLLGAAGGAGPVLALPGVAGAGGLGALGDRLRGATDQLGERVFPGAAPPGGGGTPGDPDAGLGELAAQRTRTADGLAGLGRTVTAVATGGESWRRARRRGVTLLEVVMALVLLAFCLGPMLLASRASTRKAGYDGARTLGVNLALRLARGMAERPFAELRAQLGEEVDPAPLLESPLFPDELRRRLLGYRPSIQVEELAEGEALLVRVEVTWRARPDAPRSRAEASSVVVHPFRRGRATEPPGAR